MLSPSEMMVMLNWRQQQEGNTRDLVWNEDTYLCEQQGVLECDDSTPYQRLISM